MKQVVFVNAQAKNPLGSQDIVALYHLLSGGVFCNNVRETFAKDLGICCRFNYFLRRKLSANCFEQKKQVPLRVPEIS